MPIRKTKEEWFKSLKWYAGVFYDKHAMIERAVQNHHTNHFKKHKMKSEIENYWLTERGIRQEKDEKYDGFNWNEIESYFNQECDKIIDKWLLKRARALKRETEGKPISEFYQTHEAQVAYLKIKHNLELLTNELNLVKELNKLGKIELEESFGKWIDDLTKKLEKIDLD